MKGLPGYLLFRALTGLFGLFPEPVVRRFGRAMGYLLWAISPRKRRMAERHMRRALGPDADARGTARRMFASYGRYWAEVFWMRPRRFDAVVSGAEVVGVEHIEAARAAGKGIVLALPHLGNWEAAGARARQLEIPVLAVAEALKNRRIVEWFIRVRRTFGIEVVMAEPGVTRALMERLREGGTVALPCDRDLKGRGVSVEFFGERTTLPAGPVALADRTGATILPVGCYFRPGKGHRFVVRPPLPVPAGATGEERVAAGTQLLARVLEEIIRAAPEQWHLTQPNWPSDRGAS